MPDPFADDPALIHCVDPAGRPGTHVIAIGIGHYDHLPDGGGTPTQHHLNLKQITSPPVSARTVASWFIENFDCPDKPLASVSLVLSEAVPKPVKNGKTGVSFTVPTGTTDEVKKALAAWIGRAEANPDSRIILYFSGHGLASGMDNLYLLRDYGKDPQDPLSGALNYQRFLTGLATRKPSNQFMLFDACRSVDQAAALNGTGGQGIFFADAAGRLGLVQPMLQCPVFSTELDRKAFGRPNEESLCARAFIRAMSGACSKKLGNAWYIMTDRVVEGLSDFQNRELMQAGAPLQQSADTNRYAKIPLRRLPGVPAIPVFIRLADKSLAPNVRIKAVRANISRLISDPSSAGWQQQEVWETALEVGEYSFEAEPLAGAGAPIVKSDTVAPNLLEVEL
jgi:hypothetical protein